ncbi:MAG TPA: hypothetical protein VN873_15205 [Candidatus Angelobacter sp.]|nr:hypothetical protein [Candidatus Angelobacter sp.]
MNMPPRAKRRGKIAAGYGAILLWMFLPMIPVALASAIAFLSGSQLDESGPHPCILFGRDVGGVLGDMAGMGWLGLITIPTGFVALIGTLIIRRASKSDARNSE